LVFRLPADLPERIAQLRRLIVRQPPTPHLQRWWLLLAAGWALFIIACQAVGAQALISQAVSQTPTSALMTTPVLTASATQGASASASNNPAGQTFIYLPFISRSGHQIYWGALVGAKPPSVAELAPGGAFDTLEVQVKKKMSIIHWGQAWKRNGVLQKFPTVYFDNARKHGSLPLLDWGSWASESGVVQPDFKLSTIYNGQYDAYIQQWALDAKTWAHPFFLRFDWEMNGNWQFPWSEQLNGNQAGDYIKAWRHVHDLFTQAGVPNVTWVWCPNISSSVTLPMSSLYPGDSYVDWTCLDGYNKYDTWLSFNSLFSASGIDWLNNSYQEILALAPSKPVMIGETASLEAGDGGAAKASWITDAFITQIPRNFPRIQAVVWFNWDDNNLAFATFWIESSPASISAFASAIGTPYYAANDFAGYNISPIRPLP
jgi:hypothetical protein